MTLQKKQEREQTERKKSSWQLQASRGLWFYAILIYAHVISMNIINLTTEFK